MHPATLEFINSTCGAKVTYGTPAQEVVSTGIAELDASTGGIPKGRIVEIYGPDGCGKTALALHMARQIGGPTLYVDADGGLSPYILNGQDLYLLRTETLEDTLDACQIAIVGGFRAVVIDTVAALPTNEDTRVNLTEEWADCRSRQPKVMSKALPILAGFLYHTGCTLILVNQLRETPGKFWGDPTHPTGGRAIGYYAALRLKVCRTEIIRNQSDLVIGQKIRIETVKCKYAPPGKRADIALIYGEGVEPNQQTKPRGNKRTGAK